MLTWLHEYSNIFRYILVGIIFNAIVVYYKYYHRVLYYREGLPIVMQCICCCVRISVPLFYVWQSVSLQITMLLFWIIWQMHENAHSSLISPKSAFTIRSTPPTKIEKTYPICKLTGRYSVYSLLSQFDSDHQTWPINH